MNNVKVDIQIVDDNKHLECYDLSLEQINDIIKYFVKNYQLVNYTGTSSNLHKLYDKAYHDNLFNFLFDNNNYLKILKAVKENNYKGFNEKIIDLLNYSYSTNDYYERVKKIQALYDIPFGYESSIEELEKVIGSLTIEIKKLIKTIRDFKKIELILIKPGIGFNEEMKKYYDSVNEYNSLNDSLRKANGNLNMAYGLFSYNLWHSEKYSSFEEIMISISNVLNLSFYEMMLEFVKDRSTHTSSTLDLSFLNYVFYFCKVLLTEGKSTFDSFNDKKKDNINKILHLSIFFNNPILNDLEKKYDSSNAPLFNTIYGFKNNKSKLNTVARATIMKYVIWNNLNLDECLSKTSVEKHNILEAAYYLKNIKEVLPILDGMEYTPILVNLFKSVEELCCDFFEKLQLDYCSKNSIIHEPLNVINGYKKMYLAFDKAGEWKDAVTLGSINAFISDLNSSTFRIFLNGREITERIRLYNKKYDSISKKRNAQLTDFLEKYSEKYDFTFEIKNTPANTFRAVFAVWIDKCRNGCLHKTNTLDYDKVSWAFEYTNIIIAMLCEWYWIIK